MRKYLIGDVFLDSPCSHWKRKQKEILYEATLIKTTYRTCGPAPPSVRSPQLPWALCTGSESQWGMSGCSNSGSSMSEPKKNLLDKNTKCGGHSPRMVSRRLYSTLAEKQRRDEKTRLCQRFSDCGNSWHWAHKTLADLKLGVLPL